MTLGPSPEIARLAGARLGVNHQVHYAPTIPAAKERAARAAHAAHLPAGEPILVLFDATVFGGAEDGFLITPERLCWKNLWEHPRQIAWSDLDPATVTQKDDKVHVAGGAVPTYGDLTPAAALLFAELASLARAPDASPYRRGARAPEEAPEGAVFDVPRLISIARRHAGEVPDIYYHPAIPAGKLHNARVIHARSLTDGEAVAVLYDDTVFGSAHEGFLLTPFRLCLKNMAGEPESLGWRDIDPRAVFANTDTREVQVNGRGLQLITHGELVRQVASLLIALAREARGERG